MARSFHFLLERSAPKWAKLPVSTALAYLLLGGCSLSTPQKPTELSGITQQLLIRSLERALARLDIEQVKSRNVAVEVFLQAGPETFVREFVVSWLRAHGVRTVADSPELKVKAFASVFGTDTDTTLIGIPAFQAPVVNVPVPEIALFKWYKNRGQAELRLYEFDGKTDLIVDAPRPGIGRAKHDQFTVLLIIGFTLSDLENAGLISASPTSTRTSCFLALHASDFVELFRGAPAHAGSGCQ